MLMGIKSNERRKYIYRIISLERLLELFTAGKNTLVKPAVWEDVFENFILKAPVKLLSGGIVNYNFHDQMYGQCWTLKRSSDAMWRIYSSDKKGLRIRTTVGKLADSLAGAQASLVDARCRIGKVEYMSDKQLKAVANSTFDDSGVGVDELFRSLLVKRDAFRHECEVRALYQDLDDGPTPDLYQYKVDPHELVDQIMVDPRRSHDEFKRIEAIIRKATGYKGEIKRSLLYTLPKGITLDVTDILGRGNVT